MLLEPCVDPGSDPVVPIQNIENAPDRSDVAVPAAIVPRFFGSAEAMCFEQTPAGFDDDIPAVQISASSVQPVRAQPRDKSDTRFRRFE